MDKLIVLFKFKNVDDTIAANILSTLYSIAKETACDLVMCDKKWIENSQNQRTNIFIYPADQTSARHAEFADKHWRQSGPRIFLHDTAYTIPAGSGCCTTHNRYY